MSPDSSYSSANILDRYSPELVAEAMHVCDPSTWLILLTLAELRSNVFQVEGDFLYSAARFRRRQIIDISRGQGLFDQLALRNRRRDFPPAVSFAINQRQVRSCKPPVNRDRVICLPVPVVENRRKPLGKPILASIINTISIFICYHSDSRINGINDLGVITLIIRRGGNRGHLEVYPRTPDPGSVPCRSCGPAAHSFYGQSDHLGPIILCHRRYDYSAGRDTCRL